MPLRLMALLLAYPFAVMTVDLPRYTYDPEKGECSTSHIPLTRLAAVEAWGSRQGDRSAVLLRSKPEVGMEGQRDTIHLPIYANSGVWSVWAVFVGTRGGRSCPTPSVGVNLTTAVPPGPATEVRRLEWFDLKGRRIVKPETPGVYFWRSGNRSGRIVRLK